VRLAQTQKKKSKGMGKLLLTQSQLGRLMIWRLTLGQLKDQKPHKMEKASNMTLQMTSLEALLPLKTIP